MVCALFVPDDDLPVRSGRFGPLSSDSDSPHVRRAPADAIDGGRMAVRIVPSAPERLLSQASTLPAEEFDLTQADSDLEAAVEAERPLERGNTLRFEPWVGGTPSSPEDVAPLPAFPPPSVIVEEVPVYMQGDSETDSVGLVNIPNQFVQNEGDDTDDSDGKCSRFRASGGHSQCGGRPWGS